MSTERSSEGDVMTLFMADFDAPADAPPAAPPEPVSATDAVEAGAPPDPAVLVDQAYQAGYAAGRAQAGTEQDEAIGRLVAALGDGMLRLDAENAARADAAAAAIGRLAIGLLTAGLPASFARFGTAEAVHFANAVLPDLTEEAEISVAACPRALPALEAATARLAAGMRGRVTVTGCDEMAPGAIRIIWPGGGARRDPAVLARRIADILAQFGLDAPANEPNRQWEMQA